MLAWWQLLIPGVTTITNRLWRGEGEISRPSWYAFMGALFLISPDKIDPMGLFCWILVVVGYAMLPWQAGYSIATGRPPARRDHWAFNWMQTIALHIAMDMKVNPPEIATPRQWKAFGVIYDHIRGMWMIPGVLACAWHWHSAIPLIGLLLAAGFPYVLVLGCKARDHFGLAEDKAIVFEHLIWGWLLGTYMLICRSIG